MTGGDPFAPRRSRPSAPRRSRVPWRGLAVAAFVLFAFALGLALGQALGDNPEPGQRTDVRTLKPLPLPPERETVTVTTPAR
ncbi:MAG: hypothetical protein H0V84_03070 [Actinobacteria bacterium]|nr:hypothetical protein [Actinomycetota bacterium]